MPRSKVHIRTPRGFVTSYHVAWRTDDGRIIWTWRTDGVEPVDFVRVEDAEQWKAEVWHCCCTKAEKRDRDAWEIVAA